MQWIKNNWKYILIILVISLLPRILNFTTDSINPDGVNWHYRSEQFVVGLKTFDFAKTYQHYHPGVILMWLVGPSVEIAKQIVGESVYDNNNFYIFHFAAKFILLVAHLFLSLVIFYLLHRISQNKYLAAGTVLLLNLEPFFVGNARLIHLDVLLTYFMFITLCLMYLFLKEQKWKFLIVSFVFASLCVLTKSIGIGIVLYCLGGVLFFAPKYKFKSFVIGLAVFVIAFIMLFPSMWVQPIQTISEIVSEAERVGVRKGHGQIILGEYTRDGGIAFYFLVLLIKFTPFILFGFFGHLFKLIKNVKLSDFKTPTFEQLLLVFYLGYFIVMLVPSKKIDRYLLPLLPLFAYYSLLFYYDLYQKFERSRYYILAGFIAFIVFPLLTLSPYYFTYTTIYGPSAHKILAQKPFGIGIHEVYLRINTLDIKNIGMIDTKPIRRIYPNSQTYDIRDYGPGNYGLFILGPNENFTDKLLNEEDTYSYDLIDTIVINNLEYWRIFKVNEKFKEL
jgi:hypothetical protein